jgi:hypothetical protein
MHQKNRVRTEFFLPIPLGIYILEGNKRALIFKGKQAEIIDIQNPKTIVFAFLVGIYRFFTGE